VILALEIVGIVVAVLLIAGTALRIRKVRRDEMREVSRPLDRRLVSPPPSPYAPSKGFRLLDGSGEPVTRPPVERPRLDPARPYVFSDSQNSEESSALHSRHNDDWFLSRSAHRSTGSLVARVMVIVLVIAIVAIIVTYAVEHRTPKHSVTTTTTTTTRPPTTTTVVLTSLHATTTSGDDANYTVARARYRVTVTGSRGESWAEYNMGPASTLEWQGPVDLGKEESLVMTGDSRITIGSPSSASVTVDGRPVVFPSPSPATLVLVFTPASSSTTTS
jgi:Tfp pilus assembly major pilin PilA